LKNLREAAGLEVITLARQCNLSVSQIQQLEEGGDSSFYTPEIKFNSGQKLLRFLGAAQDSPPPPPPPELTRPFFEPVPMSLPSQKPATVRIQWDWHKLDLFVLILLLLALIHFSFDPLSFERASPRAQRAASAALASRDDASQRAATAVDPALPAKTSLAAQVPVQPLAPVLPAVVTSAGPSCPVDGKEVAIMPNQASKPGNYVHVEAAQASAVVCVRDASQKSIVLMLKPGASQSVYGQAPFHISSADWRAVRLFYQGHPVTLPNEHVVHLVLNEKRSASQ
jgi:transcriptional regulator with XRE-family HTH domain